MTHEADRALFWTLILGTILYLLALPFAALMAMMSPMASDSGLTAGVWVFIVTAMSLPFALVLCPALAWFAYWRRWNRAGWVLLLLPLLWPLVLIGSMA